MRTTSLARRGLALLGWLVVFLAVCAPASARQAGGAQELTEAERGRLAKEAAELNQRAGLLHQQGKYIEASKLLEAALALRRQLYPPRGYPQGHADLAANLNN